MTHEEPRWVPPGVWESADVGADNFGAGVMEQRSLGYDQLRAIKPDIVPNSMASHGQPSLIANSIAYGPVQAPMIGLIALTSYPEGPTRDVGISLGDPNGELHVAVAVRAALDHRRRTSAAQVIDMSETVGRLTGHVRASGGCVRFLWRVDATSTVTRLSANSVVQKPDTPHPGGVTD